MFGQETVQETDKGKESKMREELIEEFYREAHDPDRNTIDFRKLRATDIQSNKTEVAALVTCLVGIWGAR